MLSPTKINLLLSVAIVVLSVFSIIWHHQNYLLYKKSRVLKNENQQITALHKQLLTEHSEQLSGFHIKQKAIDILRMQPVLFSKIKVIRL